MRKVFLYIGKKIITAVDFFYQPFEKIVSRQFFRYGVVGSANMLLDWVLYFAVFHYVLKKEMLYLYFVTVSSHIAAALIVFPITLITGFLGQKYVTFTASALRGKVQLLRYMSVVAVNIVIIYLGLKFLVEVLHIYPTPSKIMITLVSTLFSYLMQHNFAFGKK
jgi:putative flippase GtrA